MSATDYNSPFLVQMEEHEALKGLLSRIDACIKEHEKKIERKRVEWNAYGTDIEGRTFANGAANDSRASNEKVKRLRELRGCPYSTHIKVIDEEGNEESVFIGARAESDSSGPITYSLHSDFAVGSKSSSFSQFPARGRYFTLTQKREVEIADSMLLDVAVAFDVRDPGNYSGKVDPLTIQRLEANRSNTQMCAIITSIQARQADVVLVGPDSSLIVQGCAGSGKTIVMLERLTYCSENHPSFDERDYAVITPTRALAVQMGSLARENGLEGVRRLSLEDYYAWLVQRLAAPDKSARFGPGDKGKSEALGQVGGELLDCRQLDRRIVRRLYSREYAEELRGLWRASWDEHSSKLCRGRAGKLLGLTADGGGMPFGYSSLAPIEARLRKLKAANARALASTKEGSEKDLERKRERKALRSAERFVGRLSAAAMERLLEGSVRSLFERYGERFDRRQNWRFWPYLKLLLASEYYGAGKAAAPRCLCIDEAQDISLAEYDLMLSLSGDRAVFTLYGDIEQRLDKSRGLPSWDKVARLLDADIERLDTNYRNSAQITGWVNRRLGLAIEAFGSSGPEVEDRLSLAEAYGRLQRYKRPSGGARRAVIAADAEGVYTHLRKVLRKRPLLGKVDFEHISVLSVQEAKGLEFDAAIVVDDGMEKAQRYVAYTRAIDCLFVCSLSREQEKGRD